MRGAALFGCFTSRTLTSVGFAVPARRLNVVVARLPYSPGDGDQVAVLGYNEAESCMNRVE